MGSGKTTLGKKLARHLSKEFIDLDVAIEKKTNKSILDIFENEGETNFREIEKEVLENICTNKEDYVVALGGGTPCFFNNMDLINESGVSIYIKYNSGILTSRLLNSKTARPLVNGKTEEELKRYIEKTLLERENFYNKSKFIIEKNNVKVEDILNSTQNS